MASSTEHAQTGTFLLAEVYGVSRDEVTVTVAASTTLQPGQVLGVITATGKHVPYNNDATPAADGSETAAAILYNELVNDTVAPVDLRATVVNCVAEVKAADLIWGTGMDEAAGLVSLAALHIKAR